jgi:hypothetical protein
MRTLELRILTLIGKARDIPREHVRQVLASVAAKFDGAA